MTRLKDGVNKLNTDLHTAKDSHISLDLKHAEYHLRNEDMNMKTTPGKNYEFRHPVLNTTQNKEANRFRGISKPYIAPLESDSTPKRQLGKAADKLREEG